MGKHTHKWYASTVKKTQIPLFQNFILRWYAKHGRHSLPWRNTTDAYAILVSELMLQQTQVERVIPKYQAFMARFPTVKHLAEAQLAEVLTLWQGLGYNRRAKFLWQTATTVHTNYAGIFPTTADELQKLPGVGPYTARAVSTFAENNPETVIETNIRSVFLYHCFTTTQKVSDDELLPLITATIYTPNPREWYAALMDYGSYLKKILPNPSRKSAQHTTQSRFSGSPRQVRGEILRLLTQHTTLSEQSLQTLITGNMKHFEKALNDLLTEGMIKEVKGEYSLF